MLPVTFFSLYLKKKILLDLRLTRVESSMETDDHVTNA